VNVGPAGSDADWYFIISESSWFNEACKLSWAIHEFFSLSVQHLTWRYLPWLRGFDWRMMQVTDSVWESLWKSHRSKLHNPWIPPKELSRAPTFGTQERQLLDWDWAGRTRGEDSRQRTVEKVVWYVVSRWLENDHGSDETVFHWCCS